MGKHASWRASFQCLAKSLITSDQFTDPFGVMSRPKAWHNYPDTTPTVHCLPPRVQGS